MEKAQYTKQLTNILPVEIVITTGCNVQCPFLPCNHREGWDPDDPTGKGDQAFKQVIAAIKKIFSI